MSEKESPMNVGLIGCGAISGAYFKVLTGKCRTAAITACADLDHGRAEAKAAEHPGVKAVSVEELLADPDIDIVLNLTIPKAHYEISSKTIAAGKSSYAEKPLCLTRAEGRQLLEDARKADVLVGGAPDTFLGAGIQTCRKLIDEGRIGEPVGAQAFMLCHGHESWHPDPEFYYEVGGGPMFDMGPYYLTALVNLLGPVARVSGSTRITFPERVITSAKKNGKRVKVEVPTHVTGIMEFDSGAIGTIVTSFDVWASAVPRIEIFGTEGTLSVPDPNGFDGSVRLYRMDKREWEDVALDGFAVNGRGIGVADMAAARRQGRPPRASGELAYHVLDLMQAFHDASDRGRHVELASTCERPAAMPTGLAEGDVD